MRRPLTKRFVTRGNDENVNPLDGIANLADVMIAFSVGIMLALVMNWNVDIGATAFTQGSQSEINDNALVIESDNLEKTDSEAERIDGEEMEKLGTVYYDETTGKYYIITE